MGSEIQQRLLHYTFSFSHKTLPREWNPTPTQIFALFSFLYKTLPREWNPTPTQIFALHFFFFTLTQSFPFAEYHSIE